MAVESSWTRGTTMTVLPACITLVVLALRYAVMWSRRKLLSLKSLKQNCPCPKPDFLLGNVLQVKYDGAEFFDQLLDMANQNWSKGIFCIWIGPFVPRITIFKPELVELFLNSNRQITKSLSYHLLLPWLGTGLLTVSSGEKWKKRRRLVTPTFHFKILNDFIQVFVDKSKELISILKSECKNGAIIDMYPKFTLCTLDIICESSMGKKLNALKEGNSSYVNAVMSMSDIIMKRIKTPWMYPDWIFKFSRDGKLQKKYVEILHGFTNMVIDQRISERKSQKHQEGVDEFTGKRKRRLVAFLDLLLDAYDDGQIDREGVREEVDTFMFEGHDTTAAGLSWTILRLGKHLDVQRKAQEEVDEFFESRPQTLTVDSLKDLKYLECVIKESLRIHPPVPFFGRKTADDMTIEDIQIPKGTTILVAPMSLHRNPNVWPDPDKFDPDRFSPENSEGRHPYAYVPFSAGPRNCIGQKFALLEEKVVLAHILHNFNIKSEIEPEEARMTAELINRPQNGIPVSLTPRK